MTTLTYPKSSKTAYCFGMVAPSTLHLLSMPYPAANAYAEIGSTLENLAGEAVAGAWVLQRLGVQTKLDGRWLADSHRSVELLERLGNCGINCERLRVEPGYHPIEEMVIADGKTRTVLGGYIKILFTEKQWNAPSEVDILKTDVVLLDPFLHAESNLCAQYCVQHTKPYITCDTDPMGFIAQNAFATIISEEYLIREEVKLLEWAVQAGIEQGNDSHWEFIFALFARKCSGWVIFTFGEEALWFVEPGDGNRTRQYYQPKTIQLKDSTGAGDSFRAGFAYGFLQGLRGVELVTTACAVAGLVCESFPGVLHSPSEEELARRMRS